MGCENRSSRCSFPPRAVRSDIPICVHPSVGKNLSVQRGLFWVKYSPTRVHVHHESFIVTLEGKRLHGLHLPGRHFSHLSKTKHFGKTIRLYSGRPGSDRVSNKSIKSVLSPVQVVEHLGFIINFKEGYLQVPSEKLKTVRK